MANSNDIDKLVSGVAGIAVGAYLTAVVFSGNTKELGSLLKEDKNYLYFLGSLFVIGAIQKYGPASKINNALVTMAVIAALFQFNKQFDFMALSQKFKDLTSKGI